MTYNIFDVAREQREQLKVLATLNPNQRMYVQLVDKDKSWLPVDEYLNSPGVVVSKYRSVLFNELIYEIDSEDPDKVYQETKKIVNWLREHDAPYYLVYTGNKSYHVRVYLDKNSIKIDERLKEQLLQYNIDVPKALRLFFYETVKKETQTDPDKAMFNWRSDTKGHLERMEGSIHEKSSGICSFIEELTPRKPTTTKAKMMPVPPKLWNISAFQSAIEGYLKKLIDDTAKEDVAPIGVVDLGLETPHTDIPCMAAFLKNGAAHGHRHSMVYAITALSKWINVPMERAQEAVKEALVKNSDQVKIDRELRNVMELYKQNDKRFSCKALRDEFPGICDKDNCPVITGVKIEKKGKKRREKKEEEAEEEIDIAAIFKEPEEEGEKEHNLVLALKTTRGSEVEKRTIKFYLNGNSPKGELMKEERAHIDFPEDTQPSRKIWELAESKPVLDFRKIFEELKALQERFLYFPEDEAYDLLALGAMVSYFRDVFDTLPYFDFTGVTKNIGKTTAMLCLILPAYYGVTTINLSDAVLFRLVDGCHGAVGIDELDEQFKKKDSQLLPLLNGGYKRGMPIYRTEKTGDSFRVVLYDGFGLKAWTRINPIPTTLLDRAITIRMERSKGFKSVTKSVPKAEDFTDVRDKLYLASLRSECYKRVEEVYKDLLEHEREIEGREAEKWLPLLTIAKLIDEELFIKIREYAKKQEPVEELGDREEALLYTLVEHGLIGSISSQQIKPRYEEELNIRGLLSKKEKESGIRANQITQKLKQFGFKRDRKKTTHHETWFNIDPKHLENLIQLYLPENSPNSPNSPNSRENLAVLGEKGEKGEFFSGYGERIEKNEQSEDLLKNDPEVRGNENKLREVFRHCGNESSFVKIAWHETEIEEDKLQKVWEELKREELSKTGKILLQIAKECGATTPDGASGAEVIMKAVERGIKRDTAIQFFHDLQVSGVIKECSLGRFIMEVQNE